MRRRARCAGAPDAPVGAPDAPVRLMRRRALAATLACLAVTAAACGSGAGRPSASARAGGGASAPVPAISAPTPATSAPATSSPATSAPATPTTTAAEPAGWTVIGTVGGAVAVDRRTVMAADGTQITVFRFRAGRTRFALHVGSQDPPGATSRVPASAGPAIAPTEAPALLAAFNGGFQVSTGSGGVEVQGTVLSPLVAGDASLVIDTSGAAHVGVWGQGLPAAGEQVVSVRQNLPPLVAGGQPAPDAGNPAAWGATLGASPLVARSALGQDAQGDLLYAGSMATLPADLASALVSAGAVTAMELDINPEWVQLADAATPGGPLQAGVPGQHRPADQYQVGWTRDFVTVMAAG